MSGFLRRMSVLLHDGHSQLDNAKGRKHLIPAVLFWDVSFGFLCAVKAVLLKLCGDFLDFLKAPMTRLTVPYTSPSTQRLPDAGEVWDGVVAKSGEWLDQAREGV